MEKERRRAGSLAGAGGDVEGGAYLVPQQPRYL